jgi:hypothetical protein
MIIWATFEHDQQSSTREIRSVEGQQGAIQLQPAVAPSTR